MDSERWIRAAGKPVIRRGENFAVVERLIENADTRASPGLPAYRPVYTMAEHAYTRQTLRRRATLGHVARGNFKAYRRRADDAIRERKADNAGSKHVFIAYRGTLWCVNYSPGKNESTYRALIRGCCVKPGNGGQKARMNCERRPCRGFVGAGPHIFRIADRKGAWRKS